MCTRGVWQCRALMLQYCNHGGSSAGIRGFVERMLVPFAEANPQMSIAISHKVNRHPIAKAFYAKDPPKALSLKNLSAEQVAMRIGFLRDMRPVGLSKSAKAFRTTPSIQGEWEMGQKLDRPHRIIRA